MFSKLIASLLLLLPGYGSICPRRCGAISTCPRGSIAPVSNGDCGQWPSGVFAFIFDSDDIDNNGSGNSAYVNGGLIANWQNDGGNVVGDASTGTTGSDSLKPTFEADSLSGHDVISFDGVADHRYVAGTQTSASFIHETGVFHILVVMRIDSAAYSAWLASTSTSAAKGFLFDYGSPDNRLKFYILRGVGATNNLAFSPTYTITLGAWQTIEAKGDGTTFSSAKNFGAYENSAFTTLPFTAGAATNNIGIGAASSANAFPADMAYAVILISDTVLSAAQRAQAQAVIGCRYGI